MENLRNKIEAEIERLKTENSNEQNVHIRVDNLNIIDGLMKALKFSYE